MKKLIYSAGAAATLAVALLASPSNAAQIGVPSIEAGKSALVQSARYDDEYRRYDDGPRWRWWRHRDDDRGWWWKRRHDRWEDRGDRWRDRGGHRDRDAYRDGRRHGDRRWDRN